MQSVKDIQEIEGGPTDKNDSIFMDLKESKTMPTIMEAPQPVAEVVTNLSAEDCDGMPH